MIIDEHAIKIDEGSFRWSNNLHDKLILKKFVTN